MYIGSDFCPAALLRRLDSDDVRSTADAFKSWDTCMDNKTCKIVAIVGIVLACLVVFWVISTLVGLCCLGVSCAQSLCWCCCRSANSPKYQQQQPQPLHPYENPNMYPQRQPAYQPVQPYYDQYGARHDPPSSSYRGYDNREKF